MTFWVAFRVQFQYSEGLIEQATNAIPLVIRDCGPISYEQALQLQMELCARRQNDEIDYTVLIVEHPAVITLGARKSENKLLVDEEELRRRDIELIRVGRGGGKLLGQLFSALPDRRVDLHADERAKGLFHGRAVGREQ